MPPAVDLPQPVSIFGQAGGVFLLVALTVVVFALLSRRVQAPYPIVLVIAGMAIAAIPTLPEIHLNPQVVFYVILPPLLYAAAWVIPWDEFSHNLVSILSLACGLVAFTVVGVALTAGWMFPGFDWRTGVILGAVIAPTDAVSASAIAARVGLPHRLVDMLEGESLNNDATGLLALELGIAWLFANHGRRLRPELRGSRIWRSPEHDRHVTLSHEVLRVQRRTLLRLRHNGRINDQLLRKLERELDLQEARDHAVDVP